MTFTTHAMFNLGRGFFLTIKGKNFNLYTNRDHDFWFNNHKLLTLWKQSNN